MDPPAPDGVSHGSGCFRTHSWAEADPIFPFTELYQPRPKRKPQKVKLLMRIVPASLFILAIDHLRLIKMKFQPALKKPLSHHVPHPAGLLLTPAVDNNIIRITFKWYARVVPSHPLIKRIMQEEIR
jgi:hypothetical protein